VLKIGELVEDEATVVSDVGSVYIFMARHLRGWQPRHVLFSDGQQTLADASAAERYPGIAAHRQACGPCGEDFDGLLAAMRGAAGFFDGADGAGVLSVTPHDHQDRRGDRMAGRPDPGRVRVRGAVGGVVRRSARLPGVSAGGWEARRRPSWRQAGLVSAPHNRDARAHGAVPEPASGRRNRSHPRRCPRSCTTTLLRQHLRLPTGWLRRGACNIVRCDWADGTNTPDSCHRMAEPTRRPVHSPGGVAGARGETTLRSGLRDFDRTAGGSLPTRPGSRGDVSAMCHPRTV